MIGPKDKQEAWIIASIVSVFILLPDVLLASGPVKAVRSESFEQTPGVVTRSEIAAGHKGSVDYEVEYIYTVNGQQYTSKEYHVQPQLLGNGYWRAAHDNNPVGKQVTVYFDPDDPGTAYLVPGLRSDMLLVYWCLMPFNLLVAGLWWNAWNRSRRAFDPALRRCVRETPAGWLVRPDPTANFVEVAGI